MAQLTPFLLQQIWAFAMGCCLGSFFNVVIFRLPKGESLVHPGSHCPGCGSPVAAYDNIPILSYLVLRGKCRRCGGAISGRYPVVELLTGLLALVLFRRYGWHPQFWIDFAFVSLLIIIAFIDLDTFLIPDVLSLGGIALGFGSSLMSSRLSWSDSLVGIGVGGGFFLAVALGYQYLRHKEGLGGGDIKLLAMIGAFLGLTGVLFTILMASIVGMVVGLVVMWRTRQGLAAMIPFGPFLSLGAVSYILWGHSICIWYLDTVLRGS